MGNILQDMMGLLSRKKVVKEVEPTDFILLGRTPNPEDSMFVTPKMTNELITIKDLKLHFDEGEVSGSGTLNTIPLWTPDGNTLGDSIITQAALGQGVTISGQLDVSDDLDVTGSTQLNNTLTVDAFSILSESIVLGTLGDILNTTSLLNKILDSAGAEAGAANRILTSLADGRVVWSDDDPVVSLTYGSIWRGSAANVKEELAIGTAGQVLTSDGTTANWSSSSGITGTGTTNHMAMWTGTDLIGDAAAVTMIQEDIGAVHVLTIGQDPDDDLTTFNSSVEFQGYIKDADSALGSTGKILISDSSSQLLWGDTVSSVSSTTDGTALLVSVTNATTTPAIAFTWGGDSSEYVSGDGALVTFPAIPFTSLRTLGTSGAATLVGGILNIPDYSTGGSGTVESITAVSPLTGGTITQTGSIGINQASASADGYLSSTDWNTFNLKQSTSEKGQADGYAPLDSNNKVPTVHLPDSLVGAVVYQGTWDASINSPTLPTPDLSNKGHYYIVSDPGTYLGITYAIGDWVISNGSAWQKVDNTQDVNSVFGRQGNVVANQSDYDTFYADIDDAYSDAKVDLNLNVASATLAQVLSWSGTDYVWVDQQSGNPGTVTTVSASTAGDALDVLVADSSSTPEISLTWAGANTQYIDGAGNLQTFPTIPTPNPGTVTSVSASDSLGAFTLSVTNPNTTPDISLSANGAASQYITGEGNLQTFPSIPTLPANIVNTVTGGTNITTTNNNTTGDVIVNAPDAVVNTTDTFGGPKVTGIVSLTQTEYDGLVSAGTINSNTLYIIL